MTDSTIKTTLEGFGSRHPEVLGIFLYGSQASGLARASSDVDVAVLVTPDAVNETSLDLRLRYTVELEGAVKNRVDLVLLNQAPPMLRHQIFRNGTLVFERDRARVRRFIGDALVEFFDEIIPIEAAQKTAIRRHLLGQ
jgi:predicted nucleotidyltransferase